MNQEKTKTQILGEILVGIEQLDITALHTIQQKIGDKIRQCERGNIQKGETFDDGEKFRFSK